MRGRRYTMRRICEACRCSFTITSPASRFCKNDDCRKKRRKADREARKQSSNSGA